MSDMPPSITFPRRSQLHLPGVYPMGSPRPTGPVDPLYAGCYFPAPFVQNDGSDFNHTGTVFGVYSADFVELSWKKQLQVDLFGKPRKLFFTNFSWQDGDVLKETSREQIAEAYFAFGNEHKRWDHLVWHCEDSLHNDPHPICTRAQIDGLKAMNKEVTERKYVLDTFCTYLNKLEWEYKYPPRWTPTSWDLDAVTSHRAAYPRGEHENMVTTTLAFRLVDAVDQITSVAWYPAWVQSLILTSGVWNLRTSTDKHIKVWREMAAKSQWVGRVPPVKFRKLLKYRIKVFLRARREALKNLVCIAEHERDDVEDEVDDEETLCDWKDDLAIAQAMGLALRRW